MSQADFDQFAAAADDDDDDLAMIVSAKLQSSSSMHNSRGTLTAQFKLGSQLEFQF